MADNIDEYPNEIRISPLRDGTKTEAINRMIELVYEKLKSFGTRTTQYANRLKSTYAAVENPTNRMLEDVLCQLMNTLIDCLHNGPVDRIPNLNN